MVMCCFGLLQDCASELARVGSTEKKCYPIGDQLFSKECNSRRTGKEYTPLRDSTPSPVPHVEITPPPPPPHPLFPQESQDTDIRSDHTQMHFKTKSERVPVFQCLVTLETEIQH